jgi:WD40 repeat protein
MIRDRDNLDFPTSESFVALEQRKASARLEYDAFLSYRRRDATRLAQWIRNRLQRFRLPPEILQELPREKQELHARRPRIWLDTAYEKSSDDFLLKKVFPALDGSARLIVICTPSIFESIQGKDGRTQDNWLVREVDHFLSGPRADEPDRPIDVVFGPGAVEGNYPGRLSERPRWDWIDFRSFGAWRARSFSEALDDGLAKLVASLYEIPDRFLPVLRRQERRQRKRILVSFAAAGLSVATLTTALAIWAVVERGNAVTALRNVLVTQAQMSVRRASEELEKRDPARSLAAALAGVETSNIADIDRALIADSITATGTGLVSQTFGDALHDHADAVLRVTLGSGGKSALTVGADGKAILWSGEENSTLRPITSTTLAGGIFAIAENRGLVASSSTDGYVQFWDSAKPDRIFEPFNFGEPVTALAFGDDGLQIAALGVSGKLSVWDLTKGSTVWTASERVSAATNFAFGSNCSCLVVGTGAGDLLIWSFDRRESLVVHGASGQLSKGIFGEGGEFLFATDDGRVWLTSAPAWPTPLNIGQHNRLVTAVVASADRRWAATASADGTAWVWDLQKRRAWKRIKPMTGIAISSVSLSPDGASIALGSGNGSVAVWSVGDANSDPSEVLAMHGHTSAILDLTFSTDGNYLASTSLDRTTRIWRCRPPRRPLVMEAHQDAAFHALSNDGKYLVSGGYSDKTIRIWKGAELAPGKSIQLGDRPTALAISDDGRKAFVGTDRGDLLQWDTSSSVVTPLFNGLGSVGSVAISPDQRTLAAIGVHANPLLCTIESPSRCEVVPLGGWGYSVDFSEDGHWMGATSGVENEIGHALVVNLETKKIMSLVGHTERVSRIRFDSMGTRAITVSWDGTSRIWSLSSGKELVRIVESKGRISTAGFSPDGKWVAISSNEKTLRLWEIPNPDVAASTIILEPDKSILVSDKFPLSNIQFGLGGSILAGSNANGDVYLWHVPDGTLRAILDAGVSTNDMFFHPDSLQITAMTQTGRLLSWRVSPALGLSDESLLGVARSMVPMTGSLMGMTEQPAVTQPNASEGCPFLRGQNVGLPPQKLSGLARARQRVSIPAACSLRSEVKQGKAYLEGKIAGVEGDPTIAVAKLQAAVTEGEFAAEIDLGDLNFVNSINGIDFDNARTHYNRAREHGVSRAASRLGWLLIADGSPKDIAQAKAFFEESSKDGDADGFAGLAWISDRFGSSTRDVEDAFQNYIRAQFGYERDRDFAFAQEVAERRAMLSRVLPLNELARIFVSARRSIASSLPMATR